MKHLLNNFLSEGQALTIDLGNPLFWIPINNKLPTLIYAMPIAAVIQKGNWKNCDFQVGFFSITHAGVDNTFKNVGLSPLGKIEPNGLDTFSHNGTTADGSGAALAEDACTFLVDVPTFTAIG